MNHGTNNSEDPTLNNTVITASFKDEVDERAYRPVIHFNMNYYFVFKCFKSKKDLKLDVLIEQLSEKVDISSIYSIGNNENEFDNDKFIRKYISKDDLPNNKYPPYYYKSFHNGGSSFFTLPLYESLVNLFRLDNYCRVKIARLLSLPKYQAIRIRLTIVTMKYILSMVCFHESIVPKNNFSLSSYVRYMTNNPKAATIGVSLYIPLFQLLIGLQCNQSEEFNLKEFFAYEMAREIGLFDDFTTLDYLDENINEQQKQMLFSFLYYSLVLVIERVLFNYDDSAFLKEQLIFALKQGISTLDKLSASFDNKAIIGYHKTQVPMPILTEVSQIQRSKGKAYSSSVYSGDENVKYTLKEGVEWKTISSINNLNIQKTLLNSEIGKHGDQLLKIPNFEPEETFFFHQTHKKETNEDEGYDIDSSDLHIHLKEFLLTPTVIAVIYHTLRTNSGIDTQSVELNDHLAMNILLLISKFVKEKNNNQSTNLSIDDEFVLKYDCLSELVSQLRCKVFNYHVDDDDNSSIENTLNNDNFNTLLKMKIGYANHEPKSFIDVLLNKGKIGKIVLNELAINIDGENENKTNQEDTKTVTKNRARKVKEEIMNHFKNLIADFNNNDVFDNDEERNLAENMNDKEVCNICTTSLPNEILSYPVFLYHTKFPFIIDKPLFVKKEEGDNDNDNDKDDLDFNDCDDNADNENDNEMKSENDKITQQQLLISLFSNVNDESSSCLLEKTVTRRDKIAKFFRNELLNRIERNCKTLIKNSPTNILRLLSLTNNNRNNANQNMNRENGNQNRNENRNEIVNSDENGNVVESSDENGNENESSDENGNENLNENRILNGNANDNDNLNGIDDEDDDEINGIEEEDEDEEENMNENQLNFLSELNFMQRKKKKNKYTGANFTIQFGICQHLVHPDCVQRKGFKCPIDRSIKNGFLPCLDGLTKADFFINSETTEINISTLKFEVVQSIALFIFNVASHLRRFCNRPFDIFVELIKSMSGLISTYEIRLRNLPDCLYSKKTKFLARNLFLTTWYAYRIFGKPRMLNLSQAIHEGTTIIKPRKIDQKLTIFQNFIKKLIECDDLENNFKSIVDQFVNSPDFNPELIDSNSVNLKRRKKELCLFLKRVCLADYFLLGNEVTSEFLDWDEVLSFTYLFERYNVNFWKITDDEFVFKPFIFIQLPEQILQLSLEPYRFPVELTRDITLFNLLDYKYLIKYYNDFDDVDDDNSKIDVPPIDMSSQLHCFGEQNEKYLLLTTKGKKKYPSILLYIGKNASKLIVVYQSYEVALRPFYVDKNGNPDLGYRRNQPLFLKDERLKRSLDAVLSGDFTNYLEPLIRRYL